MRLCRAVQIAVVLALSCIAWVRTEFSLNRVSAPLDETVEDAPSIDMIHALNQPFHFLDRGRQTFVFESEDGKYVIKFFDRNYIRMPWYAGWFVDEMKEAVKRDQRRFFYWNSYRLAEDLLKQQTALICVHQGKIEGLPYVSLVDKAKRTFVVDLNHTPFVLQRKGGSFYDFLDQVLKTEGREGLLSALKGFLQMIDHRISLGVSDADHDVRRNFGCLDGAIFHLDPGRLSLKDLSNPHSHDSEWWRATYNLRKWLKKNHPDVVLDFDASLHDFVSKPLTGKEER